MNSFEYASVSDRIVKIVPDSSVVGMVLETPERCIVVKSDVEGIMQHFVFSPGRCTAVNSTKSRMWASSSVTFNKALNKWLANLSKEQRERAVDALFAVLEASGAGSISAMMAAGPKVIPEMLGAYVGLSGEDRRNLNQALAIMLQPLLPAIRKCGASGRSAEVVTQWCAVKRCGGWQSLLMRHAVQFVLDNLYSNSRCAF